MREDVTAAREKMNSKFGSGNEAVQVDDGEALVNHARGLLAGPGPASSAPATPPQQAPPAAASPQGEGVPGYVGELRHLAMLRDEGILTSDEFEAKKAEILSRI